MPSKHSWSPFSLWRIYFSEPSRYAKSETRISRNLLNLSIGAALLSVIFAGSLFQLEFAYANLPESLPSIGQLHTGTIKATRVGYLQTGLCLMSNSSRQRGPCLRYGYGNPSLREKSASGYFVPRVGLIELNIDGHVVAPATDVQDDIKSDIQVFVMLWIFAIAMLVAAILRQIGVVASYREQSGI